MMMDIFCFEQFGREGVRTMNFKYARLPFAQGKKAGRYICRTGAERASMKASTSS